MSYTSKRSTAVLLSFLILASCRPPNEPGTTQSPSPENVVSSTPPFQTKEPDRYSATRTITIVTASGENLVTKTLIARDGERRRTESEKVIYLDVPEGRFILLPDDKVYADGASASELPAGDDEENSADRLLHGEDGKTSYQSAGAETVGGRNTNKYRVVVNDSSRENVSLSETLIWIDDSLRMPIKSETKSGNGVRVTMELSDVTLDVDARLFQVPNDYEKIAFTELRRRMAASQPQR